MIDNKHDIGDIVYLKTDVDQNPRVIVGIIYCPAGDVLYEMNCGTIVSRHYDLEITIEKNHVIA